MVVHSLSQVCPVQPQASTSTDNASQVLWPPLAAATLLPPGAFTTVSSCLVALLLCSQHVASQKRLACTTLTCVGGHVQRGGLPTGQPGAACGGLP